MEEPNNPVSLPTNADPMAEQQPGMVAYVHRFEQQKKRQQEIRSNVDRIKTPLQKLTEIPECYLDLGIVDSLCHQARQVAIKISYVLVPRSIENANRLRHWDLWGPFIFFLGYAFFVNAKDQFLSILFSVVIGAYIVSYNVIALGGRLGFYQSVACITYCIFPIFLGVWVLKLLYFFQLRGRIITFAITGVTVLWSILSIRVFIGVNISENRKFVAVYPAVLFYIFIGLLVVFT